MSRPTPEQLEFIRAIPWEGPVVDLLAEIDALCEERDSYARFVEVGDRGVVYMAVQAAEAERDALAARVRELETAQDDLIARFHAECCEVECKCHCDELRAALGSTRRDAFK